MRIMIAVLVMVVASVSAAAGDDTPVAKKCPSLDLQRFWLPDDQMTAMDTFLDKAKRINDSGTCVVDGWFGKNEHKFYMTIVPPGASQIGRVVSFTLEELKK